MTTIEELPASYRLKGEVLEGGWHVVAEIGWGYDGNADKIVIGDIYGTGGNFSVGYLVEQKDGAGRTTRQGFLKATDLTRCRHAPNLMKKMKEIADAFEFETFINQMCADANMDRVVSHISFGQIALGSAIDDVVPYIILELADGDVRRNLRKVPEEKKTAWKLRALHHTATGLAQLHAHDIAHQDLKPSNVMEFGKDNIFKIGDMGRCSTTGKDAPHDGQIFAGDPAYAPPEAIYLHEQRDWRSRRMGFDLYMLGSIIVFFFHSHGLTALMMDKLQYEVLPVHCGGSGGWFR